MIDITADLRFDELIELGGRPVLVFGDCDGVGAGAGVLKIAMSEKDVLRLKKSIKKYKIKR